MEYYVSHIPCPSFPGKLYLSGVNGLDYLKELKISYIISLFPPLQNQSIPENIRHDIYSIPDLGSFEHQLKMNEILNKTTQKLFDHLSNGENVLVHCFAGISRSATVVIDFISTYEKGLIDPTKSKDLVKSVITYVRKFREQINPNSGFQQLLLNRHPLKPPT
jgi:protein-tyrosine phosphatase